MSAFTVILPSASVSSGESACLAVGFASTSACARVHPLVQQTIFFRKSPDLRDYFRQVDQPDALNGDVHPWMDQCKDLPAADGSRPFHLLLAGNHAA